MAGHSENTAMPIVRELKDFDQQSGNALERFIFNNRILVFVACLIATVVLGAAASRSVVRAKFARWCPGGGRGWG